MLVNWLLIKCKGSKKIIACFMLRSKNSALSQKNNLSIPIRNSLRSFVNNFIHLSKELQLNSLLLLTQWFNMRSCVLQRGNLWKIYYTASRWFFKFSVVKSLSVEHSDVLAVSGNKNDTFINKFQRLDDGIGF